MLLIGTADLDLSKKLSRAVGRGRRCYATTIDDVLREVGRLRPEVLLLDVRLGRSQMRAVEFVPSVERLSPCTMVVVLSDGPGEAERREAEAMGAAYVHDRNDLWLLHITVSWARAQAARLVASLSTDDDQPSVLAAEVAAAGRRLH